MCIHGYAILVTKKLKNTSAVQINYFLGVLLSTSSGLLTPYAFADINYHVPSNR
jgi:putative IMPACT (imprinted ancient) family translation regulator